MKVYTPEYYANFKCIADKCRHSCCIGWKIAVDSESMKKYTAKNSEYPFLESIETSGAEHCFRLGEDERCPHLDKNGLCRIIIGMGEEYLCDICREHPRFYHRLGDRIEAGLGLVCEAAAELILTSDTFPVSSELESEREEESVSAPELDSAIIMSSRAAISDILADKSISLDEKLQRIEEKFGIPSDIHTAEEWISILSELEVLDHEWLSLLSRADARAGINKHAEQYLERLFGYLVYRHVSLAESRENMIARIGFAILGVRIVNAVISGLSKYDLLTVADVARMYSSEIEYSEDNTAELIFEFESAI